MSTVRYFRHDDAGAPVLSGTVGSLTALLRAVLVGTAGIAYGSKPSAGWTEQFIGDASNIAAFRNNQSEGFSGCFARINDNAPGTAGAREAYLNVYSVMSDVNTGSNATRNFYVRKSSELSSAARSWMVAADGGTAYLYIWASGDSTNYGRDGNIVAFGDYDCVIASGAFRYFATCRTFENYASGGGCPAALCAPALSGRGTHGDTLQTAPLNGVGAAVNSDLAHITLQTSTANAVGSSNYPAAPDAAGNRRFMESPFIRSSTGCVGRMRGLYLPFEQLYAEARGDLVPGSSNLRVMRANYGGTGSELGHAAVALDCVGPW